ncbi:MAG: DUF4157 domain-containing protein [Gammaproteobacteria bacterium]|nr:DUF4157 domain-containing protein [Gammaproteobacteria bacterium]
MAEKEFKHKYRSKAAAAKTPSIAVEGNAALQQDYHSEELELGATYHAGPAYGLGAYADAPSDVDVDTPAYNDANDKEQQAPIGAQADTGSVIPLHQRQKLQARFGRDFSHVRLHSGPQSAQAARSISSHAFTHGKHIFLGKHADAGNERLLAHELTHVVQQGHARPLQSRTAIALNAQARGNHTTATSAHQGQAAGRSGGGVVQRWSIMGGLRRVGRGVASGFRAVGRGALAIGRGLMNAGRAVVMRAVRRISPDFARLIERDGITGFIRNLVARGFRLLFGGVIGRISRLFNFGQVAKKLRQFGRGFAEIVGQLARNDCSGITRAGRAFGSFMSRLLEPVTSRIRMVANAVSGFFRDMWNAIGAPIMRFLGEGIKAFVRTIGSIFTAVKNALGRAWTRVKGWFGISADSGTGEGGGIWNWIKGKATSIWNRIKGPLQPIIGPLRVVAGVLVVLSPVGPIVLVIQAWPHLKRAFQWVSQRWRDLNLVVRMKEFYANTVLPAVRDGATSVGNFLVGAANWLASIMGRIAGGIQSVTGRLSGGILAPIGRVIGFLANKARSVFLWARDGLKWVSSNARSLFRRLIEFIQPIIDVLRRIIAIAVNPFGIPGLLMGTLWRIIPNCLKGPIIDFIVWVLITAIRAIPGMFALGLLWPFIKSATLGFLEQVRSFSTQRKVDVSNKIAKIVSGMSPSFAFGYIRGIFLGIWDGIAGPFIAIQQIFELPSMIRNFLNSLGIRLCDLMEVIRCFASTIGGRVIGVFNELLESARDLLLNPGKIVDLLRCALQAALSMVASVGAAAANEMMRIFEGPEDALGEMLGRLTGSFLVDAVLAFFTAGASTATTVINRVAGFLRTIGRNLMRVVRMLAKLIPKFLKFIRKIGGMFRRVGSRAGGFLGRIGRFFGKVASWFKRMMGRVGRRFRIGGRAGRPGRGRGRGTRSRRQRRRERRRRDNRLWAQFKTRVRATANSHLVEGISRRQLQQEVNRLKGGRFRRVVRYARVRRRAHWRNPYWVLRIKRRGRLYAFLPARSYQVLQDAHHRWERGRRVIRRRLRRVRGNETNRNSLNAILLRIKGRFKYKTLEAVKDNVERDWDIEGSMSPKRKITEVDDLTGLHDGSSTDPIPIQWYKAPEDYPSTISIKRHVGATQKSSVRMISNTTVQDRSGEDRRVGIRSSSLVRQNQRLYRLKTPRNPSIVGRFRTLLNSLGYNWAGMDADHVKDLAFSGRDDPVNIWPLRGDVNKIASTVGHWYSRYRIEYIDRQNPQGPKGRITNIGNRRFTGKWFRVIGFAHSPSPNPAGRLPRGSS